MIALGPFQIEHPFILAPMAGITNSPFRRLMKHLGSSVVISELVSANGVQYASDRTLELLRFEEEERVVGLQIFGEREENLIQACELIERMKADFVDLNLGCPVPKVVKRGAGAALCRDPIALGKLLDRMVRSVKIPVTIKIRTGWDAETRNALDVVRAAEDAGVAWVAIHGRTRAQGYSGQADWDFIANIKSRVKVPIIGNGDLVTAELALKRWKDSGVDAVLIGRGALRNPFIFEQSRALLRGEAPRVVRPEDYVNVIRLQKRYLEEHIAKSKHFGPISPGGEESEDHTPSDSPEPPSRERAVMIHGRKFLSWYASGFPGCHEFRAKVFSIPDPKVVWDEAFRFFEKSAAQRDEKFLSQPFLMGGHG